MRGIGHMGERKRVEADELEAGGLGLDEFGKNKVGER